MIICVEGCAHGELDKIYETISELEGKNGFKTDILLCCGDFQATRNLADLECMAVPPKYRDICSFYKYYSGEKQAPLLTILIGGNHEASNHFQELPYGGWVAPNIYYLGYAGVIEIGGLRIAGLSGIFKGKDYYRGRYERVPYDGDTLRSCYHIRALDVFRLKQLSNHIDIMMTHDWPNGVYKHGDVSQLLRQKPFFKDEIASNSLGSKPSAEILDTIKPKYWFSAHLHVKFPAIVKHDDESVTKFLALDKCLPRRQFLQTVTIPHEGPIVLRYDLEWLTILHLTNHLISTDKGNSYLPGPGSDERWKFTPTEEEKEAVLKKFNGNLEIPNNFEPTVAAFNPAVVFNDRTPHLDINQQTTTFCQSLGIDDPLALLLSRTPRISDLKRKSPNCSKLEYSSFQISTEIEEESFCRTPLKLPAPSTPQSALLAESYSPIAPSGEKDMTSVESDESPACSTPLADVVGANDVKRFRRRNLAIYASSDDT